MTRKQELEGLHKDLMYFAKEWRKDIEVMKKDSNQAYARGCTDAYLWAATWLREVLDREVTDEEI